MFLSMNWISDFVDFTGLDKVDLIHRFSLSTAEVETKFSSRVRISAALLYLRLNLLKITLILKNFIFLKWMQATANLRMLFAVHQM